MNRINDKCAIIMTIIWIILIFCVVFISCGRG